MIRHFLRDDEFSTTSQLEILELAAALEHGGEPGKKKKKDKAASPLPKRPLIGVCLEPTAIGRRAAWARAIVSQGAVPLFLDASPLTEPGVLASQVATQCTGMVVSGAYRDVDEVARHATVPVISAGTDQFLPWQTLSDLLTIGLHYDGVQRLAGLRLTYIGDGTEARAASVVLAGVVAGMHVQIATGAYNKLPEDLSLHAARLAAASGGSLESHEDAERAVRGAHAVIGPAEGHGHGGPDLNPQMRALAARTAIVLPIPLGASDLSLAALRTGHRALVAGALLMRLKAV